MNVQLADRVQRSFSRSFDTYDNRASQQAWVADRLVAELREHKAPVHFETAFELGCGTGHLTRRLCRDFRFNRLYVNDIAPQAEATASESNADFVVGDARQVQWPRNLNLLASASMIQWMEDPSQLLEKAAESLGPGGWLAISGFGPQQYRELIQIGSAAQAPGLTSPEMLANALRGKLEIVSTGEVVRQSCFATPRKVLEHLRQTGVNARARKVWTKSTLVRFVEDYERSFGSPDGVSLTYHPVWIVARKPS